MVILLVEGSWIIRYQSPGLPPPVKGRILYPLSANPFSAQLRVDSRVDTAPHLLILTFWKAKRFPPELRRWRLSRGPYNREMHVELDSNVGASDQCHFSLECSRSANGGSSLANR
jgi:hypothetical protein